MNKFGEQYQQKLTDTLSALSYIKSSSVIGYSLAAMEPTTLMGSLHTLHGKVTDIRTIGCLEMGMYPFMQNPVYGDTFDVKSYFMMGASRESYKKGIASFVPSHLHNISDRLRDYCMPDVMLVSASPMDEHGYFRCSLCQIWEQNLLNSCKLVLLEVNPNMPVVEGDTAIHISQVDHLIEVDTPLAKLARASIDETDKTIGEYIATLVNDGDTIQLGIGSIPDAAALAFMTKHDLGVHTELLTNSIYDLVEAGVITGKKKSLHNGKIVATFALGEQKLYDMMHKNPSVQILRADYVNHPFVIAKNDNMVSINSCISVDLTGQINSETIGSMHYSGSGGQIDTAYGAIHAKNGRSIIAVHSTAKNGTVSTIVSSLAPGAIVTLSRNNVDYVVTEFGIAHLRGRSVRERTNNLIAVAHPDFRVQLRKDAEKFMLL